MNYKTKEEVDLIKINKKFAAFALAVTVTATTLGTGVVYANSTALNEASVKINQLESSLEKNYLGNRNLPTFRLYLSQAKTLMSKLSSSSSKKSLEDKMNKCEAVIIATEHIVNLEVSLDKNYKGMKNIPTFEYYVEKVTSSLNGVVNPILHKKISERSDAGNNVIKDIKVVNSQDYIKAEGLRNEAIELINAGKLSEAKEKAHEAIDYVVNCEDSFAKKAMTDELYSIVIM